MDTVITLSFKDVVYLLIMVGVFVLLCYLITMIKNMVVSIKSVNKVLKDVEVISEVAARRAKDTDELLGGASETISNLFKTIKGNQSTVGALSAVINSLMSLKNILTKHKKEQEGDKKK